MGDVAILVRKDGTAEFDCQGCGVHIVSFGPQDRRPFCGYCRELGPEQSIELQRYLDRRNGGAP